MDAFPNYKAGNSLHKTHSRLIATCLGLLVAGTNTNFNLVNKFSSFISTGGWNQSFLSPFSQDVLRLMVVLFIFGLIFKSQAGSSGCRSRRLEVTMNSRGSEGSWTPMPTGVTKSHLRRLAFGCHPTEGAIGEKKEKKQKTKYAAFLSCTSKWMLVQSDMAVATS